MKTEQEVIDLHKELYTELHHPETTPQRKKYLQSAVDVVAHILKPNYPCVK